jgi:hypothetical protein
LIDNRQCPGTHEASRRRAETCGTPPFRLRVLDEQQGEPVSHSAQFVRSNRPQIYSLVALLLIFCSTLFSQNASQTDHGAPKYNAQTETKTKGIVDDVKVLELGSRKDFVELVVKSGDDKLPIYLCPKPFQAEMGITFAKGDEIAITGSKVKQETSDVILAREVVKGTDTLMLRDDKGNAVWDWKTGK